MKAPPVQAKLDIASDEDRLVVAHSFSKSFLMTGWRLGWLVMPPEMTQHMGKLIEFNTANDKLTHGDKMALLGEASKVINSKIGINSYDLGHVFDASDFGGVANLYVLCSASKANGVSGSSEPNVGYFFDFVVATTASVAD